MLAVVDSNVNSSVRQLNTSGYEANCLTGVVARTNSGCVSNPATEVVEEPRISCTTFNILAPIYKRLDQQNQSLRESDYRAFWLARNQMILDWLLCERSSIICLQEFWVGNEELVHMYQDRLGDAGYDTFQLARTNNRGDGLLTAIRKDCFRVLSYRELLFNDFGDRVAQLLHVELALPVVQNRKGGDRQEFLIVNTHLLFPHDSSLSLVRLHQVYKILQYVETYQRENKLNHMPIVLCGDWNGSKRGHVYKFLRSQGFVSSYDVAHKYTDNDADAHKWVSHRNHRGNICGVDFIWLRNLITSKKSLKTSWAEAVFGIIKDKERGLCISLREHTVCRKPEFICCFMKNCLSLVGRVKHHAVDFEFMKDAQCQLLKASLVEHDAFAFLKAENDGDYITYPSFCDALQQVNLMGLPHGLSFQETRDLWVQADIDGTGVVDYEEFKRIWNAVCEEQQEENCVVDMDDCGKSIGEEAIGFAVKDAVLFPREAEKGMWPENYSLSDHARLTVVFAPVRMQCSN